MRLVYSPLPPAPLLWELFDYKPLTGDLVRRTHVNRLCPVGSSVGTRRHDGYYVLSIDNRLYLRHRVIYCWLYGVDPSERIVDHKNRVKGDDLAWNLRAVTCAQSSWNTKGISIERRKNGRWSARISAHRKRHSLGTFDTREEAEAAYRQAAVRLHGEYACTESTG